MANVFEAAKSVSLAKIVEDYSNVVLPKRGNPSGLTCPICGHNGCFSIYKNNKTGEQNYHCFSIECNKSGDGISFVKEVAGYASMLDAAADICNRYGIPYDSNVEPISEDKKKYYSIYDYTAGLFALLYNHTSNPNRYYFESRGLSKDIIKEYKLGYVPEVDKLLSKNDTVVNLVKDVYSKMYDIDTIDKSRIFNKYGDTVFAGRYTFPICNSRGKVIAFAGRSIKDNEAKYINTAETEFFKKQYTLFNYHKAIKYPSVIVVEGYMDCLSLVQAGIPNAVAAMGTAFGDTHLELLKGKEITLALDSDKAGLTNMYNVIMNHKDIAFKVIVLKGYKDFNEALVAGADIKSLTAHTITGVEFVIRYLCDTLDLSKVENRRQLWYAVATLIGSDKNNGYRQMFPLNYIYTPFEHSYYWTICSRIVKGKKTKGGE